MTSRRLFLGAFTAGAVTVAAGASEAAAAEAEGVVEGDTTFTGAVKATSFHTDSAAMSSFAGTAATAHTHTLTVRQAGTVVDSVALNVTSTNPNDSAMWVSGKEKARGTLKVTHQGYADGSDYEAAAISIWLSTADGVEGTRAQGIFMRPAPGNGPTKGNLITLRNNEDKVDDFVVKANGRVGLGLPYGMNPRARIEIAQRPGDTMGLMLQANPESTAHLADFRNSQDVSQTRVLNDGTLASRNVYLGGSGSPQFGGGDAVVGIRNRALKPTTNPANGGVLYAENGALVWHGSNGTVTTIAPA
ncbi:hyaluronoglucosaminidase [Streptomyces indicus]|uniref:Hyaluronidase protein (HylP) n=1 Tax=Streptomyces indicus TaxID=417292 RepID=A0A1G9HV85_9ACTN|nr:hyaluronoglucosaminidase [Streptomyces indicus]SDL16888.1 Hyaluronidase protein (HylP) [Streptomyces indicus]